MKSEVHLAESLVTSLVFAQTPVKSRLLRNAGALLVSVPLIEHIIQEFMHLTAKNKIFLNSLNLETNQWHGSKANKKLELIWPEAAEGSVKPCKNCLDRLYISQEPDGTKRELHGSCYHFSNRLIHQQMTIELLHYQDEPQWVEAVLVTFSSAAVCGSH
jgi:hypothetical protein